MSRFMEFDETRYYSKGYKIRIYPTKEQAEIINNYINDSIAIYNWALEQELNQYDLYLADESDIKFLEYFDMINLFTKYRSENPWIQNIPVGSAYKTIKRVIIAFKMFFKGYNKFPKFKSKKHLRKKSYSTRSDTMYFDGNMLRIEGFKRGEKIYTKWNSGLYYNENKIKYYNPVITIDNFGRYFVSFTLIKEKPLDFFETNNIPVSDGLGIDINVKRRFVCSDGYDSGSPDISKLLYKEKRLNRKCQKDYDRKRKEAIAKSLKYSDVEYSNRALKRIKKHARILSKIHNITESFIQEETTKIIRKNPKFVVMEDLRVNDMKSKRRVAPCVHYANFARCIEVMQYKCNRFNIPFIQAAKNFPSTKKCSRCGSINIVGKNKTYTCENCGLIIDRDFNSALNLYKLGCC